LDLFSQDGQGLRGLMPSQSQQVRVHSQVMQRCKITLYTCKLKLCTYEYEVVLADGVGSEASAAQESVDEDATSKKSPDPAACLADGVGAVASATVPDEQEASTQPQGKAKRHRISQKQAEANDDNAKDEGLDGAVAITPRAKKQRQSQRRKKKNSCEDTPSKSEDANSPGQGQNCRDQEIEKEVRPLEDQAPDEHFVGAMQRESRGNDRGGAQTGYGSMGGDDQRHRTFIANTSGLKSERLPGMRFARPTCTPSIPLPLFRLPLPRLPSAAP
jgi:hypothetical protein